MFLSAWAIRLEIDVIVRMLFEYLDSQYDVSVEHLYFHYWFEETHQFYCLYPGFWVGFAMQCNLLVQVSCLDQRQEWSEWLFVNLLIPTLSWVSIFKPALNSNLITIPLCDSQQFIAFTSSNSLQEWSNWFALSLFLLDCLINFIIFFNHIVVSRQKQLLNWHRTFNKWEQFLILFTLSFLFYFWLFCFIFALKRVFVINQKPQTGLTDSFAWSWWFFRNDLISVSNITSIWFVIREYNLSLTSPMMALYEIDIPWSLRGHL